MSYLHSDSAAEAGSQIQAWDQAREKTEVVGSGGAESRGEGRRSNQKATCAEGR